MTDDGHWLVIRVWRGTERNDNNILSRSQQARRPGRFLDRGLRRPVRFCRQPGKYLLPAHRSRRAAPSPGRGRRHRAGSRWLERADSRARGCPAISHARGREIRRALSQDAHSQVRLFDTTGKPSGEIALPTSARSARRSPAERQPNLLFLHQLSRRADDLSLRRPRGRKHRLSQTRGRFRGRSVCDRAGLLRQQGRHARSHVHHPPPRSAARR